MSTHSSTLAWEIPWMEEPGRLQSMGSLRVRHDWATSLSLFTFMHWRSKWQPTPVFLPGESQGRGSLVGCCLWGCTEPDVNEATQQLLLSNVKQTIQRGLSGSQFPSPKLEVFIFPFPSTYTLKLTNRTCLESSLPCYCSKNRNEVFPLLKTREVRRTVNSLGKNRDRPERVNHF